MNSLKYCFLGAIESWREWVGFADRNHLSMLMWDIADKNETCSMISASAPDDGMAWSEADLKEWARLARETTKARNQGSR